MTEPEPGAAPAQRRRGNPLAVVAVLVAAMAFYFALIGYRGLYLLGQDRWLLKVLGLAVLVLPVIGCWVVVAELRFGLASQRLERRLRAAGEWAEVPELPRLASGRVDRRAADSWFDEQRVGVERAPQDWRGWFRLAQAYDLAGDRRRAREALRTAIERSREPAGRD
ncbi:MAG: hypothetical protein QOE23_2280 [Pseudonocardiales bacterium]|nr:hypothetical protein [Pseudonocardiales bacterium]